MPNTTLPDDEKYFDAFTELSFGKKLYTSGKRLRDRPTEFSKK